MPNLRARKPKAAAIPLEQLPQRALEIHRMRPDLTQAFDLSTPDGCSGLYWWYYLHGFREMWLEFQPPEDLKGPVNAPVEHLPGRAPIPVTHLMRQFWLRRAVSGVTRHQSGPFERWAAAFRRCAGGAREPQSSSEQWSLVSWYFARGLREYNLEGLVTEGQATKLVARADTLHAVPLILEMVYAFASDLHGRYPSAASEEWRQWCAAEGHHRFPILSHPLICNRLFGPTRAPAPTMRIYDGNPLGVNLIGHAGTRSGVGEDLRMAARALEAVKIPFVVRNVPPSTGIGSEESGLEAHLTDHSPFSINMFCMAGMETVTMLSSRREFLDRKANIGFWPWELPEWPKLWSHAPELMDEIWASTTFTEAAYRGSTAVPVRRVPMAVDVDATNGLGRREFGLARDHFLFGYSFDGHSSFSRKNPEGSIQAFLLAFPQGDEPVGLVLKGLRAYDHPNWRSLEHLAARDRRIILISESMPRGTLLDLYRAIDCFVSLHRSEGFGRNIAECMLLGKPVIATNYSGNVDFTREGTAALVDAETKCVEEGEYPFGVGQVWANPHIGQAAKHMRQIFLDKQWRRYLASAGQTFIRTHHSPAVVGEKFCRELERLRKKIN